MLLTFVVSGYVIRCYWVVTFSGENTCSGECEERMGKVDARGGTRGKKRWMRNWGMSCKNEMTLKRKLGDEV